MEAVCAGCGAVGTVHFVPEAGTRVCTACSALAEECTLDAPLDAVASARDPWPTAAERHLRRHAYDPESGRRATQQRKQAQHASALHSAATRLGYAYASERSATLFAHVQIHLPRAHGAAAAATLYAVLRSDARPVDIAAVAAAMDQPTTAVVHAFRTLRTLHRGPFLDVRLEDPSVYVATYVAYLADRAADVPAPSGPLLRNVNVAEAQHLGTAVAKACMQYELTGLDAQPFAFAIALHALEGALQHTLVVRALLPYVPHALAARPQVGCLAAPPSGSASTVLARYAEIGKMLAHDIAQLPWARKQKHRNARKHTAFYVRDAVALWDQEGRTPPPPGAAWTQCFRAATHTTRDAPPSSQPTLAERLHLSMDAIERLSDAQVDRLLFGRDELAGYLRTPSEQTLMRQLKGWDDRLPAPPAPPQDTRRRLRGAPELYTPIDSAALSEGSDWERD